MSAFPVGLAVAALAQESAPKPAPELKKLDMLAGSWILEGDVKPNPMGPGGKIIENEKCEWMEGEFFLVCHVDFKTANSGNLIPESVPNSFGNIRSRFESTFDCDARESPTVSPKLGAKSPV